MPQTVGVKASKPKVDALHASTIDLFLNMVYQFMMMDRTNTVSFQNIFLTFNRDTPEPTGFYPDIYKDTVVYQFAHGYNYIPRVWFLARVNGYIVGARTEDYQQEGGRISANTADDGAYFLVDADATNVYVKVRKFFLATATPNNIIGATANMRIYVFANEVVV